MGEGMSLEVSRQSHHPRQISTSLTSRHSSSAVNKAYDEHESRQDGGLHD
jgi:hypothetical protein